MVMVCGGSGDLKLFAQESARLPFLLKHLCAGAGIVIGLRQRYCVLVFGRHGGPDEGQCRYCRSWSSRPMRVVIG